jgi:hypothetical protein
MLQSKSGLKRTYGLSVLPLSCDGRLHCPRIDDLNYPPVVCISIKVIAAIASDFVKLVVVGISVGPPVMGVQASTRRDMTQTKIISILQVLESRRDLLGFILVHISTDDNPMGVQIWVVIPAELLLSRSTRVDLVERVKVNTRVMTILKLNYGSKDNIPPDLFTIVWVLGLEGISHLWTQRCKIEFGLDRVAIIRLTFLVCKVNLKYSQVDDNGENKQRSHSSGEMSCPGPLWTTRKIHVSDRVKLAPAHLSGQTCFGILTAVTELSLAIVNRSREAKSPTTTRLRMPTNLTDIAPDIVIPVASSQVHHGAVKGLAKTTSVVTRKCEMPWRCEIPFECHVCTHRSDCLINMFQDRAVPAVKNSSGASKRISRLLAVRAVSNKLQVIMDRRGRQVRIRIMSDSQSNGNHQSPLPRATIVAARMAADAPWPVTLRVAYAIGAQRAPITAMAILIDIKGTLES